MDTGKVGKIEYSRFDVTCHLGRRLLCFIEAAAGDHHAVAVPGQRGRSCFPDSAVAAGDDDPHQRGAYIRRPTPIRLTTAPLMSQRSGRKPSATIPQISEPAMNTPP